MRFERSIALRYLLSKRKIGLVTIISTISIIGVTIGVAALVVVLSVFNGFSSLVTSILINFDPHLRIESVRPAAKSSYQDLISYLEKDQEVVGFSQYVTGKAVIVSQNLNRVVSIRGVEENRIADVSGLKSKISLGALSFGNKERNGLIIGLSLADRLGIVIGDTVALVSLAGSDIVLMQYQQPLIRKFTITGIYESNNKEYDSYYAYTGISAAQALLNRGEKVDGVEIRISSVNESDNMKVVLKERFGTEYRILTWYDLHRSLYNMMQIERWIAYIILTLIIGVACFNLLGSLTMSVIEKSRDIGILKSMGATDKSIIKIFTLEGLVVGIIGSLVGSVLGILVVYLQDSYHLFPLDPTVYIIPAIPVLLKVSDIILIAITSIVLCTSAAFYPAKRAARLLPADAIRWE
ncbi:MAG: FtsX-like permease family protein [bacterium]